MLNQPIHPRTRLVSIVVAELSLNSISLCVSLERTIKVFTIFKSLANRKCQMKFIFARILKPVVLIHHRSETSVVKAKCL